jgi:hypothetical protein
MHTPGTRTPRSWRFALPVALAVAVVAAIAAGTGQAGPANGPKWIDASAFDVSKPLRDLVKNQKPTTKTLPPASARDTDSELTAEAAGASARVVGRASSQKGWATTQALATAAIPGANFEGLSNLDNFNMFGFRVNPPDPVGDVGPNHYVEMINLVYGIYSKSGTLLLGPIDTGTLWAGFAISDCTDPSGDPIVVYDQVADRWLLSQFTTAGPEYFECIAISQTGDPTGAYYRYAFSTGLNFPDYPKLGVWKDSYILTTREFGPIGDGFPYGIGVYALERNKMINGQAKARAAGFFLEGADAQGNDTAILPLVGDGLLPPDMDGKQKPKENAPAPIVGTQDDGGGYGGTFDALNIWDLDVHWNTQPTASIALAAQLPVSSFDSIFPCGPSRGCIPQPGITNPDQYLDILSYRQRPTWRLAYRNFKSHESLVTSQSVEASPATAGMRWYEIRRVNGQYSLYQQGTYAPSDGVHRWMGSIAQDKKGNMALGYSVSNATSVYPGIRYTGRFAGDPLGQMTVDEGLIMAGSGVQTTTNSRWGDYTSMNVDPVDDCTFWYVNEYYAVSGLPLPLPPPPLPPPGTTAPWQTRIASFKLPGCS